MAGKADFTEQEWEALQKGVTGAALLVSLADRSFFDTFKEVGALGKHLSEARKTSQSPLIQEVAEMHGTGFGLTASPDKVENETMEALQSAIGALGAKAPEDVEAYKQFVLDVAQSVAAAAGDGDAAESEALEKIRGVLQTT
jgi:tellurite resistance protein